MKIILALNSFKDSCNSIEANTALKIGLQKHFNKNDISVFPLFDGGDGSLAALHYHLGFTKIKMKTTNALGRAIAAYYLIDHNENIAYIELAQASGIASIGKANNQILKANTAGTGMMIKNALKRGVSKIVLLIGGSATNDAGVGALSTLGIQFLDKKGTPLLPIPAQMNNIRSIDKSGLVKNMVPIEIWSDVTNPFTGSLGAVAVYSAQKGASLADQRVLEKGMINFSNVIKRDYKIDLNKIKGAGAAGGIGAGFYSILGSSITQCTQSIFNMLHIHDRIRSTDLVITGEGRLDIQSMYGKLVHGLCKISNKLNKPVIGLCGSKALTSGQLRRLGMKAAFSIVRGPVSLEEALKSWRYNLVQAGENIGAFLKIMESK